MTVICMWRALKGESVEVVHYGRLLVATMVCGPLAAICLALLSIFQTRDYPDLHLYAAIAFFCFGIALIICYTTGKHTQWL